MQPFPRANVEGLAAARSERGGPKSCHFSARPFVINSAFSFSYFPLLFPGGRANQNPGSLALSSPCRAVSQSVPLLACCAVTPSSVCAVLYSLASLSQPMGVLGRDSVLGCAAQPTDECLPSPDHGFARIDHEGMCRARKYNIQNIPLSRGRVPRKANFQLLWRY